MTDKYKYLKAVNIPMELRAIVIDALNTIAMEDGEEVSMFGEDGICDIGGLINLGFTHYGSAPSVRFWVESGSHTWIKTEHLTVDRITAIARGMLKQVRERVEEEKGSSLEVSA